MNIWCGWIFTTPNWRLSCAASMTLPAAPRFCDRRMNEKRPGRSPAIERLTRTLHTTQHHY
jgi:hypothetical protein